MEGGNHLDLYILTSHFFPYALYSISIIRSPCNRGKMNRMVHERGPLHPSFWMPENHAIVEIWSLKSRWNRWSRGGTPGMLPHRRIHLTGTFDKKGYKACAFSSTYCTPSPHNSSPRRRIEGMPLYSRLSSAKHSFAYSTAALAAHISKMYRNLWLLSTFWLPCKSKSHKSKSQMNRGSPQLCKCVYVADALSFSSSVLSWSLLTWIKSPFVEGITLPECIFLEIGLFTRRWGLLKRGSTWLQVQGCHHE